MPHSISKMGYKKICEAETIHYAAVSGSYWNMDKEDLVNLLDVMGGLVSAARKEIEEPKSSGLMQVVSSS